MIRCLLLLLLAPTALASSLSFLNDHNVEVEGYGFLGSFRLERSLEILHPPDKPPETYDRNYLIDAAWILQGELRKDGYREPTIKATLSQKNQETGKETVIYEGEWGGLDFKTEVPDDAEGNRLLFEVNPGVLYYFEKIEISGLPEDFEADLRSYFYPINRIIIDEETRFYTDSRADRGLITLVSQLREKGFWSADLTTKATTFDDETGATTLTAAIEPGPIYRIAEIEWHVERVEQSGDEALRKAYDELQRRREKAEEAATGSLLSPARISELRKQVRSAYYSRGFPDVVVQTKVVEKERQDGEVLAKVDVSVETGPQVTIDQIKFEGRGETSKTLLTEQTQLMEGARLDTGEVETARERLSRLGAFSRVEERYAPPTGPERDVVFELTKLPDYDVDLIAGVGTYDIVRGGFDVNFRDIWGVAHRAQIEFIQSLRSTNANFNYIIPQVYQYDVDAEFSGNFLMREGPSFDRLEYGGSAGLSKILREQDILLSATYNYDFVEATNNEVSSDVAPDTAIVASGELRADMDRVNNPVYPTDGYTTFAVGVLARPEFGGDVAYQSIEIGAAYHFPITDSLTGHMGLRHGLITSFEEADENIPLNRRFFLGGENTVRGYLRDEAAPLDDNGDPVGAVSYFLFQNQLDLRLSETFSLVGFVDTAAFAENLSGYPADELVMSIGGGISLHTIIAPIRFEYGYNVIRRDADPQGAFQFAIGFPF